MSITAQSTKMGPMDEDEAFTIACDWEDVAEFLQYPRRFVEKLQAGLEPGKARAIALPPEPRAATFVCRYELATREALGVRSPVVVEGTAFADVMVVRAVPDNGGPNVDRVFESIRDGRHLEITLRPKDKIGFAHLPIPSDSTGEFALALLRSPVRFVQELNQLIDEGAANIRVEEGTEDPKYGLKPCVRFEEPTPSMLQSAMMVYQVGCPVGMMVCYKGAGALIEAPDDACYIMASSTNMIACYYPPPPPIPPVPLTPPIPEVPPIPPPPPTEAE